MRYTFHILAHNNQQSHHLVAVEDEHVDHCEQPRCGYQWCWSSFPPPCWSLMSLLDSRYFIAMNVDDMVITTTRNTTTTTTTTMTTKIMMMLIPSSLSSWPWEVRITLATTLTTCLPTRNNCSPTRPHSPNTLLVYLWPNHSQPIVFFIVKKEDEIHTWLLKMSPQTLTCAPIAWWKDVGQDDDDGESQTVRWRGVTWAAAPRTTWPPAGQCRELKGVDKAPHFLSEHLFLSTTKSEEVKQTPLTEQTQTRLYFSQISVQPNQSHLQIKQAQLPDSRARSTIFGGNLRWSQQKQQEMDWKPSINAPEASVRIWEKVKYWDVRRGKPWSNNGRLQPSSSRSRPHQLRHLHRGLLHGSLSLPFPTTALYVTLCYHKHHLIVIFH